MEKLIKFSMIVVILLMFSCRREDFQFTPTVTYQNVGEMVIPSTTKIMGTNELQNLINVTENELIFSYDVSFAGDIRENDILMLGVSDLTPYGLLRKVSHIQDNGTELILATINATIGEAVKEGKIHLSQKLSGTGFTKISTKKGISNVKNIQAFDGIAVILDQTELYRNNELVIKADGEITITPEIDFEITLSEHEILKTQIKIIVTKVDELILSSNQSFNGQNEISLATYLHTPINIYGVIFTPLITISAGFVGEVSGNVMTGVRQERLISINTLYTNGEWSTTIDNSKITDFINPILDSNADFKVWSGQQMDFMIFGIVDPSYEIYGYQQLIADTSSEDWWKLYIGINGSMRINGNILGLPAYSYDIESIHSALASAGGEYPVK